MIAKPVNACESFGLQMIIGPSSLVTVRTGLEGARPGRGRGSVRGENRTSRGLLDDFPLTSLHPSPDQGSRGVTVTLSLLLQLSWLQATT